MRTKFRAWDIMDEELIYSIPINVGNVDVIDLNSILAKDRYVFMMATGLKDHSGKEIYEGDILKYKAGKTTSVKFVDGGFCVGYKNDENVSVVSSLGLFLYEYKAKILGNIYLGKRHEQTLGLRP